MYIRMYLLWCNEIIGLAGKKWLTEVFLVVDL